MCSARRRIAQASSFCTLPGMLLQWRSAAAAGRRQGLRAKKQGPLRPCGPRAHCSAGPGSCPDSAGPCWLVKELQPLQSMRRVPTCRTGRKEMCSSAGAHGWLLPWRRPHDGVMCTKLCRPTLRDTVCLQAIAPHLGGVASFACGHGRGTSRRFLYAQRAQPQPTAGASEHPVHIHMTSRGAAST